MPICINCRFNCCQDGQKGRCTWLPTSLSPETAAECSVVCLFCPHPPNIIALLHISYKGENCGGKIITLSSSSHVLILLYIHDWLSSWYTRNYLFPIIAILFQSVQPFIKFWHTAPVSQIGAPRSVLLPSPLG